MTSPRVISTPGGESARRGQIQLSTRRWAWLLDLCGLSEDDLELLASVFSADEIAELSAAIGAAFNERVLAYPELQALIESTTTVERLEGRLRSYVGTYFADSFDDDRVDSLVRIANAHDRVGVPMIYYIGALMAVDEVVIPALVERCRDRPEILSRVLIAYRRLCTCDLGIVLQTFAEELEPTTSSRIARLGLDG